MIKKYILNDKYLETFYRISNKFNNLFFLIFLKSVLWYQIWHILRLKIRYKKLIKKDFKFNVQVYLFRNLNILNYWIVTFNVKLNKKLNSFNRLRFDLRRKLNTLQYKLRLILIQTLSYLILVLWLFYRY